MFSKRNHLLSPLLFILISFNCFCQTGKLITIEGDVFNSDDKTLIPNVPVILKDDLGNFNETTTNRDGHYKFYFQNALFKKAEISVQPNKDVITPTANLGFLATDKKQIISIVDSVKEAKFNYDISLRPVIFCGPMPSLNFKKNSTELVYSLLYTEDSTINAPENVLLELTKILKDNPSIVIELSAHCSSDEKFPDKLSQERAEIVKARFINLGINEKRLVAKGYGIQKLKILDAQIKKVKTKDEKEALCAHNRRCVLKILNWDFVDPNVPKKDEPKYRPKINGEEFEK